ncbi:MAG: glycosyltransferase family 4 protein [Acidobacteriota bacterium]
MRGPRLLVLSAYYFPVQGGSETHARALVAYLHQAGFDLRVVTKRIDSNSPALERIDGVPVHRVHPSGARSGIRKWLMLPFAFAKMLSLRREFDVIYCPGYQGIGVAAIMAGTILGRPVVLRSGNLGVLAGGNWDAPLARWGVAGDNVVVRWLKGRVRAIYMAADAFVCNCREIEIEALACHVPRDHAHYLPNAVDLHRFHPPLDGERAHIRADAGWPADAFICLYVGRLSEEKGVLDVLAAWRDVRHDTALLVLVGPDMTGHPLDAGPLARAYVSDHGMSGRVRFHGASSDVARLMRAADVYVQPSHYEAFSNAVIEAMATGLPVVASRVGGMLDCIVDDENGVLSTPGDPADIARKLQRVIDDPALRARIGERARQTVVEAFDEVKIFQKFADLFVAVSAR